MDFFDFDVLDDAIVDVKSCDDISVDDFMEHNMNSIDDFSDAIDDDLWEFEASNDLIVVEADDFKYKFSSDDTDFDEISDNDTLFCSDVDEVVDRLLQEKYFDDCLLLDSRWDSILLLHDAFDGLFECEMSFDEKLENDILLKGLEVGMFKDIVMLDEICSLEESNIIEDILFLWDSDVEIKLDGDKTDQVSKMENLLDINLNFEMIFDDSFWLEEVFMLKDSCRGLFDVIEDDFLSNSFMDSDEKSDLDENKIDTFSEWENLLKLDWNFEMTFDDVFWLDDKFFLEESIWDATSEYENILDMDFMFRIMLCENNLLEEVFCVDILDDFLFISDDPRDNKEIWLDLDSLNEW